MLEEITSVIGEIVMAIHNMDVSPATERTPYVVKQGFLSHRIYPNLLSAAGYAARHVEFKVNTRDLCVRKWT